VSEKPNLISLPKPPHEAPVQHCIDVLEELLEKARSGELRSMAGVALLADDSVQMVHAGDNRPVTLLGAITRLTHWFQTEVLT
jgi:hypothetical protein